MQIPGIVKEICDLPGEISVLHNRGSPFVIFCGLTSSILFFRSAVNETDYEEILILMGEQAACVGRRSMSEK